jgi:hypothetical protein
MRSEANKEHDRFRLDREEPHRLVAEALDAQYDEQERLVTLLLVLSGHASQPKLQDAIRTLIKAAFDNSIVHSIALDEYLEAIRRGQNPLDAARARLSTERVVKR